MDERFFESLFNRKHRLLGRTLEPFSFGHLAALHAIQSPLVITDKSCEPEDVLIAVRICASRRPIEKISGVHWPMDWVRARAFKKNPALMIEAVRQFIAYRDDYCALPEMWMDQRDGTELTAPWLLGRVASLLTSSSLTEDRIWSAPVGLLVWYDNAIAERSGSGLRFVTENHERLMQLLDELEQKNAGN